MRRFGFLSVAAALVFSCGDNGSGPSGEGELSPSVVLAPSAYTYTLSESSADLLLFTTPVTRRPSITSAAPATIASGLRIEAARNEFEAVQLLIGPGRSSLQITVEPFADLGTNSRFELSAIGFVDGLAETLTPLSSGARVTLDEEGVTGIWLSVFVPDTAAAGEHHTRLSLVSEDATIDVPLTLRVFDFSLPDERHFGTQLNLSVGALVPEGGNVDQAKTLLFEHRMTPTSVTWPSGFSYNITWDNPSSPTQCSAFFDEPNEAPEYSIGSLSRRYLLGEGWNGIGFFDAELFQFVDNQTPRPETFCGVARGDHRGSPAYNQAWSNWLSALDEYLVEQGMAERGYYYVQNEPQDAEDDALAAHLCRLTRAAAPNLRIAISEEPKPSIAEDPEGDCGYDIWIAHLRSYQQEYAWERQLEHGESVWFYSLDHDPDPYFNPTASTSQGMHARIIPWAAFSHRIIGWAYYDGDRFFPGGRPSIRAELLREGFEDYEYLWLANGGEHPRASEVSVLDPTVSGVASSMQSWLKDPDPLMALRAQLGAYLEGSVSSLPVLEVESSRSRGSYYVNFQDPTGEPRAEPLMVDGKTYLKVGFSPYSEELGYGWYGEFISDPGIALTGFDDVDGYSVLSQSYVYDDYGRDNLFEFALENGSYQVTVGVGRPARGYPNDPHNVTVEGQRLVEDQPTTDQSPIIVANGTVEIRDGRLSMVVGGRSEQTLDYAYTFLGFLEIEPVD